MRIQKIVRALAVLLLFAAPASAQFKVRSGGSSSSGTVTITSGTTATSGCVAGGVLRSISNLVECGAGLTFVSSKLSVTGSTSSAIDISGDPLAPGSYATGLFIGGTGAGPNPLSNGIFIDPQDGSNAALIRSRLNGTEITSIKIDWFAGGAVTIGSSGITGTVVPLTINNGTSTGSPLVVQDNGTPVLTVADGGNVTMTGTLRVPSGAAATTALAIGAVNTGFYEIASGIGLSLAGSTKYIVIGNDYRLDPSTVFGWSPVSIATSLDTILGREAAATLQMGSDVNGAAVNQTFKAHDGITGTDVSGANLTIAAGRGTGAGTGGTLIFQTAPVGSTGTTAQTLATVLTLPKSGGLQVATGTKPTCEAATRGTLYYVAGGAGVADTYEACRKDAGDSYAWVAIY